MPTDVDVRLDAIGAVYVVPSVHEPHQRRGGLTPNTFVSREEVVTRFENRSAAPVFLARCLPESPQPRYAIVQAESSAVEPAYDPIWACVAHNNHFKLAPGAVRIDTFRVNGPNAFPGTVAIGGVFRLKLFVRAVPGNGALAATDSLGISNAFAVRTSK